MTTPADVPVDEEGDVAPDPEVEDGRGGHPVAVVTGASRGIGRHIAQALEDAGWVVERGSSAVADVTDPEAVQAWVTDILERQGVIDLLVNNAGVIDPEDDVLDGDPADWWRTVEVNVRGAYLMTRFVGAAMRERGSGRIVNLNSGAAQRPSAESSAYNVGKAALARLTGSTALAGSDCGVVAFDLMPGVVHTDMTAGMTAHADRTEWTDPAEVSDLVLGLASGRLDAWSGRFVRAGADTVESLVERAEAGLAPTERTLVLDLPDPDDPLH